RQYLPRLDNVVLADEQFGEDTALERLDELFAQGRDDTAVAGRYLVETGMIGPGEGRDQQERDQPDDPLGTDQAGIVGPFEIGGGFGFDPEARHRLSPPPGTGDVRGGAPAGHSSARAAPPG